MAILEPRQTWSIIPAQQLSGLLEQRVLIVGQMLDTGTATAGELIQDHPNDGSENTLFGRRSHLAKLIREFKRINGTTQLDIIPLSDSTAGVQATSEIAVSGTATENGTLYVTCGSDFSHVKEIDVLVDDTGTDIGDAIQAAFDLDLDSPFTALNNAGTVTFTASNGGTLANDWCIKVVGKIAGVTITLTGWNGGSDDPDLTDVLDVIENIRYRTVVWPSVYSLTTIETLLNSRFNQDYLVMDGVAIQTKVGTLSTLKTYADQNSQSICIIGNKLVNESDRKGAAIMEFSDVISAHFAAFRSLKIEDGKSLSLYLSTVASNDQFGSIALNSLPYFNTLMPYLGVPDPRDEFTLDEQVELTSNGVSVIGGNRAHNSTILGQIVTTYLTNPAGNSDDSYKYLEVVDTASAIREYFYENFRSRYAQSRLTDGDAVAGRDIVNEYMIRAFCKTLYNALALETLVQEGNTAKKDFNDNLSIVVDVRNGKVTVNMAPLLVTQIRVILGTIRINFGS